MFYTKNQPDGGHHMVAILTNEKMNACFFFGVFCYFVCIIYHVLVLLLIVIMISTSFQGVEDPVVHLLKNVYL